MPPRPIVDSHRFKFVKSRPGNEQQRAGSPHATHTPRCLSHNWPLAVCVSCRPCLAGLPHQGMHANAKGTGVVSLPATGLSITRVVTEAGKPTSLRAQVQT